MFYGNLEDLPAERHLYPAPLCLALDFLARTDFSGLETGRIDIDGERIFAILAEGETGPAEKGQWEVHRQYADVQFLLEGTETIGFAREYNGLEVESDALEEEDCLYYRDVRPIADLRLKPGHFAVFFPQDVHRPLCEAEKSGPVRKVIVKMDLNLFTDK